jgi:Fe-S-cluster containining protein
MQWSPEEVAVHRASMRQTAKDTTQRILREERTTETPLRLVQEASRQVATVVEQLPGRPAHACATGCSFCCYLPVDVTPPEALSMMAYLRTTLSSEAFAATYRRIATTAERIRGWSYEAHTRAKIPCALLVDGKCSIYPHRPLACRAWNSTSATRCEEIFHGDPVAMIPPLDTVAYEAAWSVARGLADGIRHARLDGNTYELHSILLHILESPEAAQRWARGEHVFAGCTIGAFAD